VTKQTEWDEYYARMTPAQKAEWKAGYDAIKPLVSKIPPVLGDVKYMSWDQCMAEGARLRKQLVIIHDLPKKDGISADEYMYEVLELMRARCIALHWRMIDLNIERQKLRSASRAA
jgi:hypothetical protein